MKEKIKQMIAELLMRQSYLKGILAKLIETERLTDDLTNEILDEIQEIENLIEKLKKGL